MVVIQPHENLCDSCNGSGVIKLFLRKHTYKPYGIDYTCKICNGSGVLDWISRITNSSKKIKGICK